VQEPGVEPPAFRVSFPLWSEEQEASDLALELRFMEEYPGVVGVEILSLQPQTEDPSLRSEELEAVVGVVRALVEHDSSYLQHIGVHDRGRDPYQWTRDYGRWGHVDLVMLPGETWIQDVYRTADPPVAVGAGMWTEQEGRSDLTLEIEMGAAAGGTS
jgi:hypothetical protein